MIFEQSIHLHDNKCQFEHNEFLVFIQLYSVCDE